MSHTVNIHHEDKIPLVEDVQMNPESDQEI
jgi:hypothetical protein